MNKFFILIVYIFIMFKINGIKHTIIDVKDFEFSDNYLIIKCIDNSEMIINKNIIEELIIRR